MALYLDHEGGSVEEFDETFDELFESVAAAVACVPEKDAAFLAVALRTELPQSGVTVLGVRRVRPSRLRCTQLDCGRRHRLRARPHDAPRAAT